MEGFRYRNDMGATLAPDFFKSFPPSAVMERNLVWDTGMFEWFGQGFFDRLQLNQPLRILNDQDVNMPSIGTFHNQNVVIEWVGLSQRNGQQCAVIDYRAYLNPVQIAMSGMTMQARSDYWGEIWVSLATKQIEYATINEEVNGELKLPGQDAAQPLSVFRVGSFEPVAAEMTDAAPMTSFVSSPRGRWIFSLLVTNLSVGLVLFILVVARPAAHPSNLSENARLHPDFCESHQRPRHGHRRAP